MLPCDCNWQHSRENVVDRFWQASIGCFGSLSAGCGPAGVAHWYNVLLGGGRATFKPASPDVCGMTGDFIAMAQATGYAYVETSTDMMQAAAGNTKLLILQSK